MMRQIVYMVVLMLLWGGFGNAEGYSRTKIQKASMGVIIKDTPKRSPVKKDK